MKIFMQITDFPRCDVFGASAGSYAAGTFRNLGAEASLPPKKSIADPQGPVLSPTFIQSIENFAQRDSVENVEIKVI